MSSIFFCSSLALTNSSINLNKSDRKHPVLPQDLPKEEYIDKIPQFFALIAIGSTPSR
jgi:hypothetical protein